MNLIKWFKMVKKKLLLTLIPLLLKIYIYILIIRLLNVSRSGMKIIIDLHCESH